MSERGEVKFGDTLIRYTIVRSARRRNTVEITLDPDEGVLVAAPVAISGARIKGIVAKRARWIVQRMASTAALRPKERAFVSGESLPYLGQQVPLFVHEAEGKQAEVIAGDESFRVTVPRNLSDEARRAAVEVALTRWYQRQAAAHLAARVGQRGQQMELTPRALLIRSQHQRWGSCGPDGTLRFNWRIVMAPPDIIDYVVVHELAHLRVRNHSPAFWAEVAKYLPDYKLKRASLKEIGPRLAW